MKDYCRHALLNVEFSRRRANYCGGGGRGSDHWYEKRWTDGYETAEGRWN